MYNHVLFTSALVKNVFVISITHILSRGDNFRNDKKIRYETKRNEIDNKICVCVIFMSVYFNTMSCRVVFMSNFGTKLTQNLNYEVLIMSK